MEQAVDQAVDPSPNQSQDNASDQQRRMAYLQAMGIPVWLSRQSRTSVPTTVAAATQATAAAAMSIEPTPIKPTPIKPTSTKPTQNSQRDTQQIAKHSEHSSAQSSASIKPVKYDQRDAVDIDAGRATWESLEQQVTSCQRCEIHRYRTQTVFGVGNRKADWMIIGEAPGADEDRQGEPFVGRAGQLLTNILAAINLPREQVYIANVLKCRPPNNRDPHKKEIQHCQSYLKRQIELVQPKVILVVGRIAAHTLLQTQLPVGKMRGKIHHLPELQIPLVVTYHPAYLLRQPVEKRKVWDDLKRAREVYDPLTETQAIIHKPIVNNSVINKSVTHEDV